VVKESRVGLRDWLRRAQIGPFFRHQIEGYIPFLGRDGAVHVIFWWSKSFPSSPSRKLMAAGYTAIHGPDWAAGQGLWGPMRARTCGQLPSAAQQTQSSGLTDGTVLVMQLS
jgi:hypothetical protein